MNEARTVDDLAGAMKEPSRFTEGMGGAPPASQPVPRAPVVEPTEEGTPGEVSEEAAHEPAEGEPEGEASTESEGGPEGGA